MNHLPSNPDLPRTVLVVEDESRLRDMLMRALPDMGFDPMGAGSAEQAIERMNVCEASIAILDLNLPGMSGLELFEQMRHRWPRIQVVILTGYGDLDAAKQAIHLDVADFLTKPCMLGDLEVALDRAWRRRLIAERPTNVKPRLNALEQEPTETPDLADDLQPRSLQEIERIHIMAALERNEGNRRRTADELGISPRTLYYRLAEYGYSSPE